MGDAPGKDGAVSSVGLTGLGKDEAETHSGGEGRTRGLDTASQISAGISPVPGLPANPQGLPRGPGKAAAASGNLGHWERKQAPWPARRIPQGSPCLLAAPAKPALLGAGPRARSLNSTRHNARARE